MDPVYQALLDKLHADLDGIDEGSEGESALTAPMPKAQVKEIGDRLKAAAAESSLAYIKEGLSTFMALAKTAAVAAG